MPITDKTDFLIDVSGWNTINDWGRVRTGSNISGVSVKLSQGNYYRNPLRQAQVTGARAATVAAGGYHFPDSDLSPETDARYFVETGRSLGVFDKGSLLPMLDVEDSVPDHIAWNPTNANALCKTWINLVRAETGVKQVAVYGNLHFFRNILRADEWADDNVFLWLALYNGDPGNTGGFTHRRLAIHQHTSQGIIDGAVGHIDRNVTLPGFRTADLVIGDGVTGPPPVTPPVGVPAFPLPRGEYFGLISGPRQSHGGFYVSERPWVTMIQQALQRKGYAPSYAGWADGRYERETWNAVEKWQRAKMPGTTRFGEVWWDDWAILLS